MRVRQRDRRSTDVVCSLAGSQETVATAHRLGEQGASVSVQIGGAVIRMWDVDTARRIVGVWDQLSRDALRCLPRVSSQWERGTAGQVERPAALICAVGASAVSGWIVRPPGGLVAVVVRVGRALLEVRDREAFGSAASVFREAESIANTTFATIAVPSPRTEAAATASRAFATASGAFASHRAPRTFGSRTPRTGRAWPPTAAPGQARSNSVERRGNDCP